MARTRYIGLFFSLLIFFKVSSQQVGSNNNLDSLLNEFYSIFNIENIDKCYQLSEKIDSLIEKYNFQNKRELAVYNNAKGFLYYNRNLNPVAYLRKADSLNKLLENPIKDISIYAPYIQGEYYYDQQEDYKARNAYLQLVDIKDFPDKYYDYKSRALDHIFFIEISLLSIDSDSSSIKKVSEKLINFKSKIKDTLSYNYVRAKQFLNKSEDAEKVCLAINNISKSNPKYSALNKYLALNWLNSYYYKEMGNYSVIDTLSAIKLIKVSEELLSVVKDTDFMTPGRIYQVYADIVSASILSNNQEKIDFYENQILDVINNSNYPESSGINLNEFYYTIHKLKMYFGIGSNHNKALFYSNENAKLTKFLYGEASIEHSQELRSYMAILRLDLFKYDEAYEVSKKLALIIKSIFNENSIEYLETLNNQYGILLNQQKHKEGLQILRKANKIRETLDCEDEEICREIWISYLDCLNSNNEFEEVLSYTSGLYEASNYKELFQVSNIRRSAYSGLKNYIALNTEYEFMKDKIDKYSDELLKENDIEFHYYKFIQNYQEYIESLGRLDYAIDFSEKHLSKFENSQNETLRNDFILNYLGILFQKGECKKALEYIKNNEVLRFSDITNPNAKLYYEFRLNITIGNIYHCLENYNKGQEFYEKAISYKGTDTNYLLPQLILILANQGKQEEAERYLEQYESNIKKINDLDEAELYLIVNTLIHINKEKSIPKYLLPLAEKTLDEICYKSFFSNEDNQTDQLTHEDIINFIHTYNSGDLFDAELASYGQWISNLYKKRLDYYAQINLDIQKLKYSNEPIALELDSLEAKFNESPSELIKSKINGIRSLIISSRISEYNQLCSIDFNEILNNLNDNELIIDLVSYMNLNSGFNDYTANFISKNRSITLSKLVFDNYFNLKEKKDISSGLFSIINNDILNAKKINKDLIDIFYIIPSGKSNLINFSALSLQLEKELGRKLKFHIINSLADIPAIRNEQKNPIDNVVLIGDIDYNLGDTSLNQNTQNKTRGLQLVNSITDSNIPYWGYLPGSKKEIEEISDLCYENKINVSTYSGNDVTESNLNKIIIDPKKNNIIHVATHGFFFADNDNDKTGNYYASHSNPLLRSGLVLSGANKNWNNKVLTDPNNDGILTSQEISLMNLSGVELVVLSACDTGLGEVSNLHGINGLQRAIKLAGAKKLIMSLWKVPDKETSEFFGHFYQFLLNEKLSVNESFRMTQKVMNNKYEPYYWAAFVLLE
ncbi:CHAT domain-containing protein [Aestuariivivens sediminis]|uniref:CHAT domain-containing protein n=1 Tax=Aestuariivivens sediminis TaxID=2913557 RepID=UPI001F58C3F7|nr:CHAT domain-containing protein [Aestuariivivens sediminis]